MKICFASVICCFALGAVGVESALALPTTLAQAKKVRTSVSGSGKTEAEAESDARKSASKISPTYTVVRKSFGGSKGNYTCNLVIEYTEK
jgi:hypothetical protein